MFCIFRVLLWCVEYAKLSFYRGGNLLTAFFTFLDAAWGDELRRKFIYMLLLLCQTFLSFLLSHQNMKIKNSLEHRWGRSVGEFESGRLIGIKSCWLRGVEVEARRWRGGCRCLKQQRVIFIFPYSSKKEIKTQERSLTIAPKLNPPVGFCGATLKLNPALFVGC